MGKRVISILKCFILVVIFTLALPLKVHAVGNDQPRVIVTDYELEDGGITPGKTNQLTITLKNMNREYAVYSVLVTCQISSKTVNTEYGHSNQAYVESIQPNAEAQIVIPLVASDILDSQTIEGILNISYKDDIMGVSSTETSIHLPIKQEHLKIQRTYIPQTAVIGVKSRVSVTFENIVNEEIYNTVMSITGNGIEETRVELGTILNQSMKNQEVYIIFNAGGEQDLSIAFTYEDPNGNSYQSEPQTYKVDVQEKTSDPHDNVAAPEQNTDFNITFKQKGYFLAFTICVIGSIVIIVKKIKR